MHLRQVSHGNDLSVKKLLYGIASWPQKAQRSRAAAKGKPQNADKAQDAGFVNFVPLVANALRYPRTGAAIFSSGNTG
jgi:hypothetical protein